MNAEILREEEHEHNRINFEFIIPVHGMDDVTASSMPKNVPDDIKEEMTLNERRLVDNKLVEKAFNASEYEVSRDDTSKVLALTFNIRGIIECKSSECLHYTMFKFCLHCLIVSIFTNTLNKLLSKSFKKAKPVSYIYTAKHYHPTGSGIKQGYKHKWKSNKRKETTAKHTVPAVLNKIKGTVTQVPPSKKNKTNLDHIYFRVVRLLDALKSKNC